MSLAIYDSGAPQLPSFPGLTQYRIDAVKQLEVLVLVLDRSVLGSMLAVKPLVERQFATFSSIAQRRHINCMTEPTE